jgi:hypothetical protein
MVLKMNYPLSHTVVNKKKKKIFFLIGIREISNDLPIDELTLLFGHEILNDEKNTKKFLQVQKFFQDTGRFTIN